MDVLVVGIAQGALAGVLAVGIVLVYKTTRVLNFSQGEVGTFAMYILWMLVRAGVPWGLALLGGLAAAGAVGLVFEKLVVRPMRDGPKLAIAVATLGLLSVLGFFEIKVWTLSPQFSPQPFSGVVQLAGTNISATRIFSLLAAAVVGAALYFFLKQTTFGLGLLASAEDPTAVRLMGVKLRHLSQFTWVSASVLGGLAGILALTALRTFHPFAMTPLFVQALTGAVVGGLTSLGGAFGAALALGVLNQVLIAVFPGTSGVVDAAMFIVLLAILVFRPQGLLGRAA